MCFEELLVSLTRTERDNNVIFFFFMWMAQHVDNVATDSRQLAPPVCVHRELRDHAWRIAGCCVKKHAFLKATSVHSWKTTCSNFEDVAQCGASHLACDSLKKRKVILG